MAVQHILLLIITIHDQTLHNLHTSFPFAMKYCLLAVNVYSHFMLVVMILVT